MREQPAFDVEMKTFGIIMVGKATQTTGCSHPVTRDDQREPIGTAGLADRSRRGLDQLGNLAIGTHFAARDARDRRPNPALEVTADLWQGQGKTMIRVLQIGLQLLRYLLGERIGRVFFREVRWQVNNFLHATGVGANADRAKGRSDDGGKKLGR